MQEAKKLYLYNPYFFFSKVTKDRQEKRHKL